jgi:hypothetical protein
LHGYVSVNQETMEIFLTNVLGRVSCEELVSLVVNLPPEIVDPNGSGLAAFALGGAVWVIVLHHSHENLLVWWQ